MGAAARPGPQMDSYLLQARAESSRGCPKEELKGSHSVATLRPQAIVASVAAFFLASTLPAVSYYYVFQLDNMYLGPQAWAHWGVVLVVSSLGIVAHGTANTALTVLHVAAGAMMGAALGGYNTAFWFSVDITCQEAGPGNVLCDAVLMQSTKYILAFTGLATVVFLAVPVAYSLLVLCRAEAARSTQAAKRYMVSFAVDTQTSLIAAGDRPTVSPAMLWQWIDYLMEVSYHDGDALCGVIAGRCREELAQRGYHLPAKGDTGSSAPSWAIPSAKFPPPTVSASPDPRLPKNQSVSFYPPPPTGGYSSPGKQTRLPQVAVEDPMVPRHSSQQSFPGYH